MSLDVYYGKPADPADRVCEFCDKSATRAITVKSKKLWAYSCETHTEKTRKAAGKRSVPRGKLETAPLFDASPYERPA